jgi:hypothetical protein
MIFYWNTREKKEVGKSRGWEGGKQWNGEAEKWRSFFVVSSLLK